MKHYKIGDKVEKENRSMEQFRIIELDKAHITLFSLDTGEVRNLKRSSIWNYARVTE